MRQNLPQMIPRLCRLIIQPVQKMTSPNHELFGKITARDVEEARRGMELRHQEWLSLGSPNPPETTILQANNRRRETRKAWKRELYASCRLALAYAWVKCRYYLDRYSVRPLHYLSKWNDIGMFVALLITGALGASLGIVITIAFSSRLMSALAIIASTFVLGVAFPLGALLIAQGSIEEMLHHLGRRRREQAFRRKWAQVQYQTAAQECIRLKKGVLAKNRYEEAKQQYEQYLEIHQSKKNQLLVQDWRALRGVDFEQFLREVFEDLGFSVQTTKASGDQGVDLIVTINGYCVAIQSKGYASSVGNASVQEVYAGMQYYHCDACAVVTNSRFTRAAIDLAHALNCQLIDETDIPKLIRGELALVINSR